MILLAAKKKKKKKKDTPKETNKKPEDPKVVLKTFTLFSLTASYSAPLDSSEQIKNFP